MKKIMKIVWTSLACSLIGSVQARDLLVVKKNDCTFKEGLVLSAEEGLTLIETNGKITKVKEDEIDLILTYGLRKSPFKKNAKFSNQFSKRFKKITLRDSEETVVGIPFQYIEDLVFVLNSDGKVIVIGLNEIYSIKDYSAKKLGTLKSQEASVSYDYNEQLIECGKGPVKAKQAVAAIRVLGDNLKVSEYITNYRAGERGFLDLQERTNFYSKPYLYPRRNRMGITQLKSAKENALPFYYQWATGTDFHFQSLNQFGGTISRYLPSFETNTIFSSEFKSHFFHGYFEGNLAGLSAGNLPADFNGGGPKETVVVNNFNYFAFMGGDWKQFSVSYGGGYFVPYFNMKNFEGREVAANSISKAIRVGYTQGKIKINHTTYLIDDSSSNNFEIDDQLNVESKNGIGESSITEFAHKSTYHRTSVEWQVTNDINLFGNLLVGEGDYSEKGTNSLDLDYKTQSFLLGLKRTFGHYITLTLLMKSENYEIDSKLNSSSKSFDQAQTSYGGVFELLF